MGEITRILPLTVLWNGNNCRCGQPATSIIQYRTGNNRQPAVCTLICPGEGYSKLSNYSYLRRMAK